MKMNGLLASYLRSPVIFRILVIVFFVELIFGTSIYMIEPQNFPTLFDGIWWAFVTTATVGYGDFVPTTTFGRIVAILLILLGTGFVTTYFITLATTAVAKENTFIEGKTSFKGCNHLIIIGWNERVRKTILQLSALKPPIKIILIDGTVNQNPLPSKNVHFIKGNPTQDETLQKANVHDAEIVLITADQNKDEVHADMNAVLTLLAIKGINPNIYSIIEVLTSQQVNNAKRAGADEVIQTNILTSYVMINSIISHGMTDTLLTMLDQLKGSKLKYIDAEKNLIGKTFREGSDILLQQKKLLIGIKRREESYVNPSLTFIIEKNDELLVIQD